MYEIYCKLKDEKGLKDADVVKATGITKSTFSDWKSGRSKPKQDKIWNICLEGIMKIEKLKSGSYRIRKMYKGVTYSRYLLLRIYSGKARKAA